MQPPGLTVDLNELFGAIDRAAALAAAPVLVSLSLAVWPYPSQGKQRIVITVTIVISFIFQRAAGDDPAVLIVTRIVTSVIGDDPAACGDDGVTIPCSLQAIEIAK